ncbi:MAG: dipeptide ABC transporter ATP-binding protein [Hyphomicrobiaceae bacterium]
MADILAFEGVSIAFRGRRGTVPILDDLSFAIAVGEAYGLVGESGCGKSTVAMAALRYLPPGMALTTGRILFEGRDLADLDASALRTLRGNRIAMVYQDPMSSLNPVMTVGRQLVEVPLLHGERDSRRAWQRAVRMLDEVRLADPEAVMGRYPHELSGGQQQRVTIAMALMAEPALLVLDEPTTGLDVTIEAAILELVRDLRRKFGAAILFISHNLGTVARISDRIGVLYAGRLMETGPIRAVFRAPAHPYTRGLLAALPDLDRGRSAGRLTPIEGTPTAADRLRRGCAFAPRCPHAVPAACSHAPIPFDPAAGAEKHFVRCIRAKDIGPAFRGASEADLGGDAGRKSLLLQVDGLTKRFAVGGSLGRKHAIVYALTDASVEAYSGGTLAIVGESGSGKSTLAKVLAGLFPASAGRAELSGADLAAAAVDDRPRDLRRRIQMVFQNPDSTLNPSHTVEFALMRPLKLLRGLGADRMKAETRRLLERVRLPADLLTRKPHQLSGGQRQRVAIARALAGNPDLVIADEPVSALDVSVQAAIVNLLEDLQQQSEIGLILISHDLALVRHMADWVAVMYGGRVVEYGPAAQVFAPPYHPYTEALLAAVPKPDPDAGPPRVVLSGTMHSATEPATGCPFAGRCPHTIDGLCATTPPPQRRFGAHRIACHLELTTVVVEWSPEDNCW